jgi:hypothetical protein
MFDGLLIKTEFWSLVLFSLVVPFGIFWGLLGTRKMSHGTVLGFGILLVVLSGLDFGLLKQIFAITKAMPSLADDKIFNSEYSIALYLLPVLYAGVGTNMISHILISHLKGAEQAFDLERENAAKKAQFEAHRESAPGAAQPAAPAPMKR